MSTPFASQPKQTVSLPKPFWILWAIELWERFGYYGMQAIIPLYFLKALGFSQKMSFYTFGSFAAFVYGFIWFGGFLGDKFIGAKRTIFIGALILAASYTSLAFATKATIFFSLGGIIMGNALFKANPSSLISKLYKKGDAALDGAMTLYYMAINIGAFISMAITPIIANAYGWKFAFGVSAVGLIVGLVNYITFYRHLESVSTIAGKGPIKPKRIMATLAICAIGTLTIGLLLPHTRICYTLVGLTVAIGFIYYLKIALSLEKHARTRMLIAFVLILEGIIFFVLYNQMPTSLTFFALHNINNHFMQWHIPAAEYQVLNPFFIMLMSPILAFFYKKTPGTHVTKFAIGMTLCALAFLVLYIPRYTAHGHLVSPLWMVLSYGLQSTGELLVSALGLAMVAELCPRNLSGFVMGIWFLTTMLAGPVGAWVGVMTAPPKGDVLSITQSLMTYTHVFGEIGLATLAIAIAMWISRPYLNRHIEDDAPADHHEDTIHGIIETA